MTPSDHSKGSTQRSKNRKGSKSFDPYRETGNDEFDHVQEKDIDVNSDSNKLVMESEWSAENEHSRDSWATYSPTVGAHSLHARGTHDNYSSV